jgi:hypothetical protein
VVQDRSWAKSTRPYLKNNKKAARDVWLSGRALRVLGPKFKPQYRKIKKGKSKKKKISFQSHFEALEVRTPTYDNW